MEKNPCITWQVQRLSPYSTMNRLYISRFSNLRSILFKQQTFNFTPFTLKSIFNFRYVFQSLQKYCIDNNRIKKIDKYQFHLQLVY
jgi:hypothetical protein